MTSNNVTYVGKETLELGPNCFLNPNPTPPPTPSSNSLTWLWILLGCLIGLILIAGIVYAVCAKKKKPAEGELSIGANKINVSEDIT